MTTYDRMKPRLVTDATYPTPLPVVEVDTPGFDDSVLVAVERRVATLAPTCEHHTMTVVHYGEEWTATIAEVRT